MAPRTKTSTTGRGSSPRKHPAAEHQPTGGLAQWKNRAGPHTATLCLGTTVEFRLLSIDELALHGALPDELRELVALHYLNLEKGGLDAVLADDVVKSTAGPEAQARLERHTRQAWELNKTLAALALLAVNDEPVKISDPNELDGVPVDELHQLVRLVTGREAFDSRGVRIGVEPLDVLARFHHHHGIPGEPSACEACLAYRRELSSLHVGAV